MSRVTREQAARIIAELGLAPLPVEGGLFVQTWKSMDGEHIAGTATYAAFTDDPDSFSAMHRLPVDEIWHFYAGDSIRLLLLHPGGEWSTPVLGPDILAGELPQLVVPAGTWMGGRLDEGGVFGLFGNTLAPGFHSGMYQGGTLEALSEGWPEARELIASLVRPDHPLTMPDGL